MSDLVQIGAAGAGARRPAWLRIKIRDSQSYREVGQLIEGLHLNTVCQEARCPNIWECWGEHRTATLMILGDVCTRACRYCSVTSGKPPAPPDPEEPANVARAVAHLKLQHAVITSVDRDDLADAGADHFVATVAAIRAARPGCRIELLIPDFAGDEALLTRVIAAGPDVLGHNIETVPRLFARLRSRGDYRRSLDLLQRAARQRDNKSAPLTTKSGLMVGLGESLDEIFAVMRDLRAVDCDVLTVGQYLNPTRRHAAVERFYTPEEFARIGQRAREMGFRHCESGPLVRSSYHAHTHAPRR